TGAPKRGAGRGRRGRRVLRSPSRPESYPGAGASRVPGTPCEAAHGRAACAVGSARGRRYTASVPKRLALSLLRETAGLYVLGVAAICLLQSVDMLSVLARFLVQNEATLGDTGRLLLYKVPWFLHLGLPVAVVFAVLLACGRMAKDSELKAAYSAGVAPQTLFWPLVGLGLVVGLISFVNNGFVEARAEAR